MKKLFNLKRLLSKRNNGGFTLVEVIISVALLGILVIGVTTFATPVMNMVKVSQKSARATMLAEAIDVYISGCLRSASRVEVITNTTLENAVAGIINESTVAIADHMRETDPSTGLPYSATNEVRCIGISWLDDNISGRKKQVLINCKVNNNFSEGAVNNLNIILPDSGEPDRVFDDSLYLNLFPVITLENFFTIDSAGDPTDKRANGYKIISSVYTNLECYNTLSIATRSAAGLAFEGSTYVECVNMAEFYTDDANKFVKENLEAPEIATMFPYPASTPPSYTKEQKAAQDAIDSLKSSRQYSEAGNTYYYPDTYIFYVVPI